MSKRIRNKFLALRLKIKSLFRIEKSPVFLFQQQSDIKETSLRETIKRMAFNANDCLVICSHMDDAPNHVLSFLVADDGIGVRESLSENVKYAEIGEAEALRICVKDAITG